ncbi:MAG: hypothetical protein LUD17_13195 [Bacteroidales bacterium]|nr:hypothetical protein [Bacteroidales bacterium]
MIRIIDTSQFNVRLKATIQKTGRLGFTEETARVLNLSTDLCARFAMDDEQENSLFLVLSETEDSNSFRVTKSGQYYYLPTKLMFDAFGYNYKEGVIIFDLVRRAEYDATLMGRVYQLKRKEK